MTEDAFRPVPRRKTTESVVQRIEDLVLDIRMQQGDALPPERELAARLSVSRNVLREALGILQQATRDPDVSLLRRVLVSQSSRARGVTHPVHRLRRGGAGRRRDRVCRVPEIVKVESLRQIGHRRAGTVPVAIDGALSQCLGALPSEEVAVRSGTCEGSG